MSWISRGGRPVRALIRTRRPDREAGRIDESYVASLNDLVRVWRQQVNVTDPFAAPVRQPFRVDPVGGMPGPVA